MPYLSHGFPQWKSPPMYSKVIQCIWPSTMPATLPYSVGFGPGVPVALSSASGNVAQPWVGVKRMVVGHTVQQHLNSQCDGALWRIDVGLAKLYDGPIEVLGQTFPASGE